jgi:hypothetical protein
MRKLPVVSGVFVAGALAVAACGGSNPASTAPSIPPLPSFAVPSFAIPSFPTGSFAIPSFAFPSFNANADPDLAARFPKTVAGQPVTNVVTYNFVELFTAFGGGDAESQAKLQAFVQLLANNGINAATLSFGSADATVNDSDVTIQAFRTPGGNAATFISLWPQLAAIDQTNNTPPTAGSATVGGKTVTTFTDSDGNVTYVYPSGDVVWSLDSSDQAEADAVFSAIQ